MIFLSNIYLTVRYFYTLIYPSISSISLINLIAIKGNKSSTRYLQRFRNFLPRCLSTIHRFVHNLFLTSFALISSVFFSLSLSPSFLPSAKNFDNKCTFMYLPPPKISRKTLLSTDERGTVSVRCIPSNLFQIYSGTAA